MERYFDTEVIGIIETDADFKIVRANSGIQRMLGFNEGELLQRTWMDVTHPDDIQKTRDHFDALLELGKPGEVLELRYRTKTRHSLSVAVNVHAGEIGEDGRPRYYVGFVMDISRQKEAESFALLNQDHLNDLTAKIGKALCDALGSRDPYTSGHQDHAAHFAGEICAKLGLSRGHLNAVVAAANIHDIGKIGVPSEYLSKPTKLEDFEWAVIKSHAKRGYEILSPMQTEYPVAEIVYQHHERLDGAGYPRGLRGNQILREAQIVAAADTADSIINPRPFRKALGNERAIMVLREERGVKISADIVDACIEVIEALP